MAGRPRKVELEVVVKIFEENISKIIVGSRVRAPKDEIWQKIFDENDNILRDKTNCKAIYNDALRWWQKKNESKPGKKDDRINTCSSTETTAESELLSTKSNISEDIIFSVNISKKNWEIIQPVPMNYNKKLSQSRKSSVRKYLVLPAGIWTNVIVDHIARHPKNIVCSFTFKRAKVHTNADNYITIHGKCATCKANLYGTIKEKPHENSDAVKISFILSDFNEKRHQGKNVAVKNYGAKARKEYIGEESAKNIQRENIKKTKEMFKGSKGRPISRNAVQCGKYRKKLEEKLSSCPLTALQYLKHSKTHGKSIQAIGLDPFYVMYNTINQQRLYNAYRQNNDYTKVSCDASGSVVNKLVRPGNKLSPNILLYIMVISDGYQTPINSMLSEAHNANIINFWLNEWIRNGATIPNEFVCDMSLALLNAGVRAFAKEWSVHDYVNTVYQLVNAKENNMAPPRPVPSCFIRIDLFHLMQDVFNHKALKDKPKKVMDFFIRCVALLTKMDSLQEAREHIKAVLITAYSEMEGTSTKFIGMNTPCEINKNQIKQKIMGLTNPDHEYEAIDQREPQYYDEMESIGNDSFSLWLLNIDLEAKEIVSDDDSGDRDNLMHNPLFAAHFLYLCKTMVLWSGICCKIFSSPNVTSSSGDSECAFKNIKQSLAKFIPTSADNFVKHHLDMIDADVKEASQKYIQYVGSKEKNNDEMDVDKGQRVADITLSSPNQTENDEQDVQMEQIEEEGSSKESVDCPACKLGNLPEGAHKCIKCRKNVHIFPECSVSIGEEEGYGERRMCKTCSVSKKRKTISPTIENEKQKKIKVSLEATEMNYTEKWSKGKKPKKIKNSKYLQPDPEWNSKMNIHTKDIPKIRLLVNGTICKSLPKIGNKKIALNNTCAFDSVVQALAAACVLSPLYKGIVEKSKDDVFDIAISLASNSHMTKVNKSRALFLLKTFNQKNCAIVASEMVKLILPEFPSYMEKSSCKGKKCKTTTEKMFPILLVDSAVFDKRMGNLKSAVLASFPKTDQCKKCSKPIEVNRDFGRHLFIEIPSVEIDASAEAENDYETYQLHKLRDIPLTLDLAKNYYTLIAAILFQPPLTASLDNYGHYTSAIKMDNNFIVFDDMRAKTYYLSIGEEVVIHALLYTQNE